MNMLPTGNARTFSDYADPPQKKFGPYVMNQMKHANRVDVVWDTYFSDSLEAETRRKEEASESVDELRNLAPFLEIGKTFC